MHPGCIYVNIEASRACSSAWVLSLEDAASRRGSLYWTHESVQLLHAKTNKLVGFGSLWLHAR